MLFRAPSLTPINVGSDEDVTILELAQKVAEVLNPDTAIHVAGVPAPGSLPSRYVPSINRARQLLGLEQKVNLEESIRRTAAWYGAAAVRG
jgi:dTDP-glucose 4,6-dehydratase